MCQNQIPQQAAKSQSDGESRHLITRVICPKSSMESEGIFVSTGQGRLARSSPGCEGQHQGWVSVPSLPKHRDVSIFPDIRRCCQG